MNDRTCIVTRQAGEPDGLLRFVVGPDMSVVPDLKRQLPGRGCWVSAERVHVDELRETSRDSVVNRLKKIYKGEERR